MDKKSPYKRNLYKPVIDNFKNVKDSRLFDVYNLNDAKGMHKIMNLNKKTGSEDFLLSQLSDLRFKERILLCSAAVNFECVEGFFNLFNKTIW